MIQHLTDKAFSSEQQFESQLIILARAQLSEETVSHTLNNNYDDLAIVDESTVFYYSQARTLLFLHKANVSEQNLLVFGERMLEHIEQCSPVERQHFALEATDLSAVKQNPEFFKYFLLQLNDGETADYCNARVLTRSKMLPTRRERLADVFSVNEYDQKEVKLFKQLTLYF